MRLGAPAARAAGARAGALAAAAVTAAAALAAPAALVVIVVPGAGCVHVHLPPPEPPRSSAGFVPGDRVVARWREGFWEATVVAVNERLVTIAWDSPPPERADLPAAWVVGLDRRGTGAGDVRLCPSSSSPGRWAACAAAAAGRGSLPVPDELLEWARAQLPAPPAPITGPVTVPGVESVKPLPPPPPPPPLLVSDDFRPASAGRKVKTGQRVAAHWQNGGWWDATVSAVDRDQVTVAWADGSGATTLPAADVAPLVELPAPGQDGLCLWHDGRYWTAFVDKQDKETLSVTFADGSTAEIARGRCLRSAPVAPTPAVRRTRPAPD